METILPLDSSSISFNLVGSLLFGLVGFMFSQSRSSGWSYATVLSWRMTVQRFSFAIFLTFAVILLIAGRIQPAAMDRIRVHAIDHLAPVLDALSRPVTLIGRAAADLEDYFALREENVRLRAANAHVQEWQNYVVQLEKENKSLRGLLNFKTEPNLAYISARVIADTGGAFTRGLIVTAGRLDGVRDGMAAMTGQGLIGRVIEVGDWSSRILLITDLSSRIPVVVSDTGDRAILTGDHSPTPRLLYLPQDATLHIGARVVTSGHGGVFPPNLPIGTVIETGKRDSYALAPAADLGRIDAVRLVDFNLKGGTFNPIAHRIESETQQKKR